MRATGRQVKVARDYQLTEKDFHNVDLVMSLGGDGTFLKTASMINSNKLAIFGVNTDPSRSVGHLTSIPIPYE
jgi:NAD+ kinase